MINTASNNEQLPQGMTLSAFNARIERLIGGEPILQNQWVIAETSGLRLNRSGHCYTELIEKDERGTTIAKVDAVIWASNYPYLYYKF
ncbi:MAG: exodeoxyribonuclease VII large subunit, partial [Muribaculaceae bacterium]|nr:exodeoxyribonuclease VII large subunit [Muribaculaceae bacterium]